MRLKLFFQALK